MELIEVNFNDDGDIIDTLSGKIFERYARRKSTPAIHQHITIGLWLSQSNYCERGSSATGIKDSQL